MPDSTKKIKEEIEAEKSRRSSLSREDLEKIYIDLEKDNFPPDKRLRFIGDLSGSNEMGYHYELICKDWDKELNQHLEMGFEKHDRQGIEFLFKKLDEAEDKKIKIYTAYLIGQTLSKLKHRDFYLTFRSQLSSIIVSLLDTDKDILRQKLIIALGWVGSYKEIDLLANYMISDKDALCRAWSATSLMQMLFNGVSAKDLQEKTKLIFAKSLAEEKDLYACGLIVEAGQIIFGKKWITSSAVENKDSVKIEKGKKSALRFLEKLIKDL